MLFIEITVVFFCVSGTSYTGGGEAAWAAPSEAVLSSGSGTGFLSLNQSKCVAPYDQQMLLGAMYGPADARYVRPDQLTRGYAADAAQTDVGYGSIVMPPTFTATTGSQLLDTARNVDHSFGAVSLRSPAAHSRQDFVGSYSPMSASTPAVVVASSVEGVGHLPTHEWNSAAVPANSGPRSHNLPSTSWQNMHQQADSEFTATTRSAYFMTMPQTTSYPPSQVSTSVGSPNASSTSGVPSPVNSPYSPSVGKTYSEAAGSEALQLPLHMQPHYLENLLQLHYLLLASNKLLAPRYPPSRYPPSVGAPRFDTYIPGSAGRPTAFDINRLSSSPGSFQHGFTAARFPRLALNCGRQERYH